MAHVAIGQNSVLNVYAGIECTDGQQVVFQSDSARANYFNNHRVAQFTGMSYVYHNGVVKVQAGPGTMVNANYISFNNPNFESKPIYARITDWQYINNATVALTYEVDWFQTFMFDFTAKSSLISREHLSESDWSAAVSSPWRADIMELNQDEGITLNPYDYNNTSVYYELKPTKNMYAAFLIAHTTVNYDSSSTNDVNTRLAGFYDAITTTITSESFSADYRMKMNAKYAKKYTAVPLAANMVFIRMDAIVGKAADSAFINSTAYPIINTGDYAIDAFVSLLTAAGLTNQILSVTALSEAQIRELAGDMSLSTVLTDDIKVAPDDPKLKRYPFCYIEMVSPSGATSEYTLEGWQGQPPQFVTRTSYDLSSRTAIPYYYMGARYNYRERFDTSPMFQIPYTTDNFLTYLSQCYQETADRNTTVGGHLDTATEFTRGELQVAGGVMTAATAAKSGYADIAMQGATSVGDGLSAMASAVGYSKESMAAGGLRGSSGLIVRGDPAKLTDMVTSRAAHPGSTYHTGTQPSVMAALINPEYNYTVHYPTEATANLFAAYFAAYGYKTGRIGVPRVCNYINASGSMPHWASIDGRSCTYVQTSGLKVIAPLKPAADYIRAIFDTGCRFVKGD